MSDRLAVMSSGRIVQMGAPQHVYEEPATAYVADFLGVSNLLDATVTRAGGDAEPCVLRLGDFPLEARCGAVRETGRVRLAIRPERIALEPSEATGPNRVPAMVERTVFLGSAVQLHVRLATGEILQTLVANDGGELPWRQGAPAQAYLPADALRVLAADGQMPDAAAKDDLDPFDVPLAAPPAAATP
ncbi:MAG: TOBE domain-containing protein [Acidimicrobiales bacterium]